MFVTDIRHSQARRQYCHQLSIIPMVKVNILLSSSLRVQV